MKIPAKDVEVRRVYLVDCVPCGEAVEPQSGAFPDRADAEAAKARHLAAHASGEIG